MSLKWSTMPQRGEQQRSCSANAWGRPQSGVATLQCRAAELEQALAALSIKPTFISAYVSPHLDIDPVARTVTRRFQGADHAVLHRRRAVFGGRGLYCNTGDQWDRVVLQCFDASLIAQVSVMAVPLGCEDIRRAGGVDMTVKERVARIARNIQACPVGMRSTTGTRWRMSFSTACRPPNRFFMEALYDSGVSLPVRGRLGRRQVRLPQHLAP